MDASDTKVKAALTELAEELPVSEGAWAEQRRMQAARARARRRRMAVPAAVAVVVAVLAVGGTASLLSRSEDPPVAVPPVVVDVPSGFSVGPVRVAEFIELARDRTFWTYVERTPSAGGFLDYACAKVMDRDEEFTGRSEIVGSGHGCGKTVVGHDGPARLHPMPQVICESHDPTVIVDCAGPGVVVVAAAPEVARLELRAEGGATVHARELGRTDKLALFVADFRAPEVAPPDGVHQRFAYTARDQNGAVIDQVTFDHAGLDG